MTDQTPRRTEVIAMVEVNAPSLTDDALSYLLMHDLPEVRRIAADELRSRGHYVAPEVQS